VIPCRTSDMITMMMMRIRFKFLTSNGPPYFPIFKYRRRRTGQEVRNVGGPPWVEFGMGRPFPTVAIRGVTHVTTRFFSNSACSLVSYEHIGVRTIFSTGAGNHLPKKLAVTYNSVGRIFVWGTAPSLHPLTFVPFSSPSSLFAFPSPIFLCPFS